MVDTLPHRVLLAAALSALAVIAARRNVRPVIVVAGLVLAALVVAIIDRDFTLWAFHGEMHWSFALAAHRSIPPEDPSFAGEPLLYPWAANWFYGWASARLGVSPLVVLAATDVLWLALMLMAVVWTARRLRLDRASASLAAVLAWAGLLLIDHAWIELGHRFIGAVKPCGRMCPADKFFDPNANPIGLALGALAVLGVVRLAQPAASDNPPARRQLLGPCLLLVVTSFACGILYPISAAGVVVLAGGACLARAIAERRFLPRGAVPTCLSIALGLAAALPFMLATSRGKGPEAQIRLSTLAELADKAASLPWISALAVIGLLAVATRVPWPEDRRSTRTALIGAASALAAAYLAVHIPLNCEYKFLLHTAVPLALLVAPGLALVACGRRSWWATLFLAVALLSPIDRTLIRFDQHWGPSIVFKHGHAHARSAPLDALLTFIREHTPAKTVVLAEVPHVPTVAERSLFLLPGVIGTRGGDGWSMGRYRVALEVIGHPRDELLRREAQQRRVLQPTSPADAAAAAQELRARIPSRPVVAIITDTSAAASLRDSNAWTQIFQGKAGVVFQLTPSPVSAPK